MIIFIGIAHFKHKNNQYTELKLTKLFYHIYRLIINWIIKFLIINSIEVVGKPHKTKQNVYVGEGGMFC